MSARAVSSRCCQCTASHARTYNSFIPLGIYISSLAAAAAEQSSRSIGENAVNRNIYIYIKNIHSLAIESRRIPRHHK